MTRDVMFFLDVMVLAGEPGESAGARARFRIYFVIVTDTAERECQHAKPFAWCQPYT